MNCSIIFEESEEQILVVNVHMWWLLEGMTRNNIELLSVFE
jgi:flagellar biogenesis protein FliO